MWSVSCRKTCRPNCQTFLCALFIATGKWSCWKPQSLEAAVLFKPSFSWRECQKSHQISCLVTPHCGTWWIHQERPSRQAPPTLLARRFEAWWSFTADNTWWWRFLFGRDIFLDSYDAMTNDSFHVSLPCPLSSPTLIIKYHQTPCKKYIIVPVEVRQAYGSTQNHLRAKKEFLWPARWSWRSSMKNLEDFNSNVYIVLPVCLAKWERCNKVAWCFYRNL